MNEYENPEIYQRTIPVSRPRRKFRFRIKPLPHDKPLINIVLFILTIFSTYITAGAWYSFATITILLSHEMGHYLMCRKYGVPATLPFFIPFPKLNPFGTMGAVIQMRGAIPNRRALFDIAAAGPLASFFLSIPAIYFGMAMSHVVPVQSSYGGMLELGDSLLFKGISFLVVGHLADNVTLVLHPLSYAGWVGLFVTALNLLPIGQLDGGHVIYSIFGRDAQKVGYIFLVALGVLTIIYPGWGLLFVLLLFFGRRHPAPIDDYTPLDRKRRLLGIFILLIFITCFTPIPFKF